MGEVGRHETADYGRKDAQWYPFEAALFTVNSASLNRADTTLMRVLPTPPSGLWVAFGLIPTDTVAVIGAVTFSVTLTPALT